MPTRKGRRVDPCEFDKWGGDSVAPFLSILCDNLQVYGRDAESAPPSFIVRSIVQDGAIMYDPYADTWARFVQDGRRAPNGLPYRVRAVGDGGRLSPPIEVNTIGREGFGACVIPANAYFFPPVIQIAKKVETMEMIATATGQNIDAIKQASAVIYSDPDMRSQVERANDERLRGGAAVSLCVRPGQQIDLKNFAPDAKSFLPDLLAIWVQTMEELDALIGRATLGEKNERRITDEISVIEDAASSSIDVIANTFNRYAEWYGIDAHIVRGVALKKNSAKQAQESGEPNPIENEGETEKNDE